jgi:hypothetical protein
MASSSMTLPRDDCAASVSAHSASRASPGAYVNRLIHLHCAIWNPTLESGRQSDCRIEFNRRVHFRSSFLSWRDSLRDPTRRIPRCSVEKLCLGGVSSVCIGIAPGRKRPGIHAAETRTDRCRNAALRLRDPVAITSRLPARQPFGREERHHRACWLNRRFTLSGSSERRPGCGSD